ncbi:hypothetical protein QFC21_000090 [Naganishia friedmannii]|uniref:Uncharacterized protein n=1 Tax=Naganishia friedmannii TaxID=89922 RepID=A0ACC2WBQ3_9TREE|nr:hypothetical protein QFC21_000090 [Naganishia friedmannii]
MSSIDPHQLDAQDPLAWAREEFEIPLQRDSGGDGDGEVVYLCGNSLGLLPKKARTLMMQEIDVWSKRAVYGHFAHPHDRPWKNIDDTVLPGLAKVVGAKQSEIAHTSTLTSNIHSLFISFYRPTKTRWRIVLEKGAFPSDWYAIHSHPRLHEAILSPEQIDNAVIALEPRQGEETLRTEDILSSIEQYGEEATSTFVQLTPNFVVRGWLQGAYFGLDLAHAVGNVPLELSKWGVDFAAWCTYKYVLCAKATDGVGGSVWKLTDVVVAWCRYLNSGPGAVAGYYIKDGLDDGGRRLAGWWGQNRSTRFLMSPEFDPIPGAQGYQHSNPPVFSSIPLIAHLELLERAGGMRELRKKSEMLTRYLWDLLEGSSFFVSSAEGSGKGTTTTTASQRIGFRILTPSTPSARGCQLSLMILPQGSHTMERVFNHMVKRGVVGDERRPDVIRLSPVPLYNRFVDVQVAVRVLEESLQAVLDEGDV